MQKELTEVTHKSVKLDIFPVRIHLLLGPTLQEIDLHVSKYDEPIEFSYNSFAAGLTHWSGDNNIYIILPAYPFGSPSLDEAFIHECVHAACNVIDKVGAEISSGNQELITYLTQFIFKTFKEDIYECQNNYLQPNSEGETDTGSEHTSERSESDTRP